MSYKISEQSVINSILKYLNGLDGCLAKKRHGGMYGQKGEPDITGCYKGRRIEIEAKAPGNKPTVLQLQSLENWSKAGAIAFWADNVNKVRQVMEELVT